MSPAAAELELHPDPRPLGSPDPGRWHGVLGQRQQRRAVPCGDIPTPESHGPPRETDAQGPGLSTGQELEHRDPEAFTKGHELTLPQREMRRDYTGPGDRHRSAPEGGAPSPEGLPWTPEGLPWTMASRRSGIGGRQRSALSPADPRHMEGHLPTSLTFPRVTEITSVRTGISRLTLQTRGQAPRS